MMNDGVGAELEPAENDRGPFVSSTTRPAWLPWLVVLLAGAVGLRAVTLAAGGPLVQADTSSYVSLGRSLLSLNLAGDLGWRTPVYPLFMALMRFDSGWIRMGQMCLGLTTTVFLFFTAFALTRSGPLALFAGAAYGWSPSQVSFENILLTETLAVFFLVGAIALYAKVARSDRPSPWLCLALGLVAALAALTRPVLIFVPVVLLIAVWIRGHGRRAIILVALAGLGPILAWSTFNYARLGYFGPTTITGGSLTNHTGAYIEDAPDQYATIKRIYLDSRAARHGNNINVIWNTWQAMSMETGQPWPQLSQTLTRMSIGLIATHPVQYGRAVARDLARLWLGVGWMRGTPSRGPIDSVMALATKVWRVLFALLCAVTLPLAIIVLVRVARGRSLNGPLVAVLAAVLFVLLASALLASIADNDDTSRYGLPLLSIMGLLAVLTLQGWLQTRRPAALESQPGEESFTSHPPSQATS